MYRAAAALKTFFSGFDLPAYAVDSVPDDVTTPYVTFSLSVPNWDSPGSMYVEVWDRTTTNSGIIKKADEITAAIGQFKQIDLDGGYLVIRPESPLIQIRVDGDYRSAYINLSVNAYQLPGF